MNPETTTIPAEERTRLERRAMSKGKLGFWIYLMSDMVLFSALFATFMILRNATNGGVSGHDIFDLPYIFIETVALLCSSVTSGIAYIAATSQRKRLFIGMMVLTIALGLVFLVMELSEFHHLAMEGHSWAASGFLSAYFTLVGTHGLHISVGLLWAIIMVLVTLKRGLNFNTIRRVGLFSLFWHFLDLVWIFIFSIVYLTGALA